MKNIILYIITLSLLLITSDSSAAGKLAELEKKRSASITALEKSKLLGLGHSHPRVQMLQKLIAKLDLDIENAKELHQEIVILIEGQKSHYLVGHARHGKTDKALTELLNAGWKIQQIIPAGTTQEVPKDKAAAGLLKAAYVWLSYEE